MSNTTATPGTLGFHRDMAAALLGADSPAVMYMDEQIYGAPQGRDTPVIKAESTIVGFLIDLHTRDQKHIAEVKARNVVAELY